MHATGLDAADDMRGFRLLTLPGLAACGLRRALKVALSVFLSGTALGATDDGTVVLAVGVNHSFKSDLQDLKYAADDARRFAKTMEVAGLLAPDRITVLTDTSVARLVDTVRRLQAGTTSVPSPGKFIFYFSGHSDEQGLHLADGSLPKEELQQMFASMPARVKVAILDSCSSGALARKGVKDSAAFAPPRATMDEPSGTVFLTASFDREPAYESKTFAGGLFTNNLIAGLYGAADVNKDGVVTVDEAYQYAYVATQWQSLEAASASAQKPAFSTNLYGHGLVALSYPARTAGTVTFAPAVHGTVRVSSYDGLQSFQFAKAAGLDKEVTLPSGRYRVVVADANGVGKGEVVIVKAQPAHLDKPDLVWDRSEDQALARKGGSGALSLGLFAGSHRGYVRRQSPGAYFQLRASDALVRFGRAELGAMLSVSRRSARMRTPGSTVTESATAAAAGPTLRVELAGNLSLLLAATYGRAFLEQEIASADEDRNRTLSSRSPVASAEAAVLYNWPTTGFSLGASVMRDVLWVDDLTEGRKRLSANIFGLSIEKQLSNAW
jgi:hypothetical protein